MYTLSADCSGGSVAYMQTFAVCSPTGDTLVFVNQSLSQSDNFSDVSVG